MLKKISGYTTRFLFYVRNNFLSFIFKSSVFLTLLTLIYLVSVLRQANSVQKSQQNEVQHIAKSQKLMLTIPTMIELPPLTTENPTTMDNLIPKVGIDIGAHPFFPIQEPTTSPILSIDPTSPLPIHSKGFVGEHPLHSVEDYTSSSLTVHEEAIHSNGLVGEYSLYQVEDYTTSSLPVHEQAIHSVGFVGEHPLYPVEEHTTSSLPVHEEAIHSKGFMDEHPLYPVEDHTTSSLPVHEEAIHSVGFVGEHPLHSVEDYTSSSLTVHEEAIHSNGLVGEHPLYPVEDYTTSSFPVHEQAIHSKGFMHEHPLHPVEDYTLSSLPVHEEAIHSVGFIDEHPHQDYTTATMMVIEEPSSPPALEETTPPMEPMEHPFFLFSNPSTHPMIPPETTPSLPTSEETTSAIDPIETESLLPSQDQPSSALVFNELFTTPPVEETTPVLESMKAHPFIPIQEQTTPQIEPRDVYSLLANLAEEALSTESIEPIEATSSFPAQEQTTSYTFDEKDAETSTQQEETTNPTEALPPGLVPPFKRSLTPNELKLFENPIDNILETTTSTSTKVDDIESTESTEVSSTESTTDLNLESNEITSTKAGITELPETSDLFGDREEPDVLLPTDSSSEKFTNHRPFDNLFQDEDHEFNTMEEPVTENETDDDDDGAEDHQHQSAEDVNVDTMITDSNEQRLPSLNTHPFDLQNNLFNLFNFDHFPAMSNIKPMRWSNSDNAPVPMTFSSMPGQQVNTIFPIADSDDEVNASPGLLQRLNRFQHLDSLLNMRIKDSVSLLERLFGNFLT